MNQVHACADFAAFDLTMPVQSQNDERDHSESMEFTGERMVPGKTDPGTFWEHVYRYRFAVPLVRNKRVLDIACGEGYGTAALSQAGAASIIGVDISEEACDHARAKYGIEARVGSAEAIPLEDHSVDVIVSFETLEHVAEPERFLDECVRILAPHGILVISTPNKEVYTYGGQESVNPFHCSEMTEKEFIGLLAARFSRQVIYSQQIRTAAWWSLRCLASPTCFWYTFPGCWRVKKLFQWIFPQRSRPNAADDVMNLPIEAILAQDSFFASLANPYSIRRRAHWTQEEPSYLLAVAQL